MNILTFADGKVVQFITYATSKETGCTEVVYQEMNPPYLVYTIEESRFNALLEGSEKLSEEPVANASANATPVSKPVSETKTKQQLLRDKKICIMEQFFDAETFKDKIRILEINREDITSDQLELMAAAMDEYIEGVDQDELFFSFMQVLKMRARFESDR
ncbi:MAG: hypothetical protein MJ087_01660 [Lachnospiraceae bacterium]|nr:hypothetical protein [Lachnospiraceae bacterium]